MEGRLRVDYEVFAAVGRYIAGLPIEVMSSTRKGEVTIYLDLG
jgi:hypothetical protein